MPKPEGDQPPEWTKWNLKDFLRNADRLTYPDFRHIWGNYILPKIRGGSIFSDPNNPEEAKARKQIESYEKERKERDENWGR
jgi:hypothetical protein